jgi:hypothetical protein
MDAKLQNSRVDRGGAMASRWNFETRECSFKVNADSWSLDFLFRIDAAGGGQTDVALRIGLGDLPIIAKGIDELRTLEVTQLRQRNFQLNKKVGELEAKAKTNP